MSDGWYALAALGVQVRPLSGIQPRPGNRYSQFSASWRHTVSLLAKELNALDAKKIVLGLDIQERDIRLDGLPRANARLGDPTVEIAFESKHGPLQYATAEFTTWQDNVRAIALSLEALRAVDRYGVSKRGEQYRGWRAIPASVGDPTDRIQTREDAYAVFGQYAENGGSPQEVVRAAIRATHPDHGGDPVEFRKVLRAKEILGL